MEFTKLFKYVSASLFLILLAHGLFLGFSIPTTIISIVLLLVCFAMEQKLVLHEREQFNTKIQEILTDNKKVMEALVKSHDEMVINLNAKYEMNQTEIQKKLEAVHSQMNLVKTAQGMTSVRRNA